MSEFDLFMHFMPVNYIRDVLIQATNENAQMKLSSFKEIEFEEFIHSFGAENRVHHASLRVKEEFNTT